MWLSSVQIRGFKSFAERFEFSCSQGITGMAGPAGWGRTNLIEAIRWALGEPSLTVLTDDKRIMPLCDNMSGITMEE
jgi:chromosome segregation protein